jgi:hypothetical protein
MMPQEGKSAATVGDRLYEARARRFVGRAAERAVFGSVLKGETAVVLLWVRGPGGIGKSALLDQFAGDARTLGRAVVRVDGRDVGASPEAFAAAVLDARHAPGMVVLVDTFEQCGELEGWLRRDFAPQLPADAVLVVASRHAPGPEWRAELAWSEMLQVITLDYLTAADASALLETRDVPDGMRASLLGFAGGHPLALSLAAAVVAIDPRPADSWVPGRDVLRSLISALVGAVPSAAHQHALQVCAHAYDTSEELLRATLGLGQGARALFDWLCDQPYIEFGSGGVFPHDVIRDALDADLRWRDPQGYEAMHRSIRHHLLERFQSAAAPLAPRTLQALSFLHWHGGVMPDYVTWQRQQEICEDDLSPADKTALLSMTTAKEGEESARIAGFWLSRQPAAFRVYRRPGSSEPVGFMAWLRLTDPAAEDASADPVVAAVWEHSRSTRPIRSGEHLAVARFAVNLTAYQRPGPVTDLIQMRILSEWLRSTRLAWSYIVVADPDFWRPQMDYLDQHLIASMPAIGDRIYGVYAHDWREIPVETWLDRHVEQELFGPRSRPPVSLTALAVLSREEFNAAVRSALRSWRRPDQFAANPLTGTRLVVDAGNDPATALRQALTEAAGVLAEDPRTEHLHRAVEMTFFRGVPTQEAAAERLGLPLSTYRRHLARGVEEICDVLWGREVYGAAG